MVLPASSYTSPLLLPSLTSVEPLYHLDLPMLTSLIGAFGAGCGATALLALYICRRTTVKPYITVESPAITLPDSLRVVLQQPAPPPAPRDRGVLWQEVYERTLEDQGTPSYESDVLRARASADAAVRAAFPPCPPNVAAASPSP
jgi:hypothetical protein